jgi:predicted porin
VLQLGAKVDYQFSREFSVFAGLNYDRYSASYSYTPIALNASTTINDVRGIVGMAYHY